MERLNECRFNGRLTRDPEVITLAGGSVKANFSLAVSTGYYDKNNTWVDDVHFVNCVAWGKLAGKIADKAKKGAPVSVTGSEKTERWEKDGQKQQRVVLWVSYAAVLAVEVKADRQAEAESSPAATARRINGAKTARA